MNEVTNNVNPRIVNLGLQLWAKYLIKNMSNKDALDLALKNRSMELFHEISESLYVIDPDFGVNGIEYKSICREGNREIIEVAEMRIEDYERYTGEASGRSFKVTIAPDALCEVIGPMDSIEQSKYALESLVEIILSNTRMTNAYYNSVANMKVENVNYVARQTILHYYLLLRSHDEVLPSIKGHGNDCVNCEIELTTSLICYKELIRKLGIKDPYEQGEI
jgi:hypothetical protein